MDIRIIEGTEGARQATDIAVVIDVLRAATVSAYLLGAGVDSIIPVATLNEAFNYKNHDHTVLLVGEDKGIKIPGFDIGNSPSEIIHRLDLSGRKVVHRSSTGTQGLVTAQDAKQVIFGSFVTVQPIMKFLQQHQDRKVVLVPMYAPEDHLLAEYIQANLLGNQSASIDQIKNQLSQHEWLRKSFLNPNNKDFPEEDFHLAVKIGVFDFFPLMRNGRLVKTKSPDSDS